jgi:hypothetical protein
VPIVRHTGGLRDTVFDVDFDKARAAWELQGSSDWERDGIDATNGFAFEVGACSVGWCRLKWERDGIDATNGFAFGVGACSVYARG